MRRGLLLLLFGCVPSGVSVAGMDWKAIWIEPGGMPVVLGVGQSLPYTVMGLNGAGVKADLTYSEYLKIASSNPDILEIDRGSGVFTGKKAGYANIRISFSEAWELVPAFVREPKTSSGNAVDGIWKAVFTGSLWEQPKMVSQIVFDVHSDGNSLTGTVHASAWPGDALISEGKIHGDRVSFTMIGHLPFHTGSGGVLTTGYPKLCFAGVVRGREMKIDLLWTEAHSSCEEGKLLPMAATKVGD